MATAEAAPEPVALICEQNREREAKGSIHAITS